MSWRLCPSHTSAANWFMVRGGSLQALKELLGHADIKTTLIYAHLSPAHLRNEVAQTERRSEPASRSAQGSAHEVAELEGVSFKWWCRSGDSNPDTLAGTRP